MPPYDRIVEMERLLGCELMAFFQPQANEYEIFLSAPITSIPEELLAKHRSDVEAVADALKEIATVYWPGEPIHSHDDLLASDKSTSANKRTMVRCHGLVFVQFAESTRPSNCLVELGIALGRRMKTTVFMQKDVSRPAMFRGLDGVAARNDQLPDIRIYGDLANAHEAVKMIRRNGRGLLGLSTERTQD